MVKHISVTFSDNDFGECWLKPLFVWHLPGDTQTPAGQWIHCCFFLTQLSHWFNFFCSLWALTLFSPDTKTHLGCIRRTHLPRTLVLMSGGVCVCVACTVLSFSFFPLSERERAIEESETGEMPKQLSCWQLKKNYMAILLDFHDIF